MYKWTKAAAVATAITFAIAPAGIAATAKKAPAKKPAAKAPAKPAKTPHVVQGTTQLKGEYAEFGTTYTLGKDYPMNITLKSAEYTVEPVRIGETVHTANADEKLLVLHMTYHNPQSAEYFVRWDSFGFTVVDSQDQNHDGLQDLGAEKDKLSVSMSMKPAQKMDVYGVMKVPAAKETPKLIIKSSDQLVLRYDLRGKVKGMSAPYADPADKSGATALAVIAAKPDTYYPAGLYGVKLNKVEKSAARTIGENEIDEGQEVVMVTIGLKNISGETQYFNWDSLDRKLIDVDDVDCAHCIDVLQAGKDRSFSAEIPTGKEHTVRYAFSVPEDTDLKLFTIESDGGRRFEFDITGMLK